MKINVDSSLRQSDWVKKGTWDLPTTLDALRTPFMSDSDFKLYMKSLVMNPSGRSMPESLIKELRNEYGQHFVPKYLDKRKKPETKDVYVGGDSVLRPIPDTLHTVPRQKQKAKRSLRKRRLITYRKPEGE